MRRCGPMRARKRTGRWRTIRCSRERRRLRPRPRPRPRPRIRPRPRPRPRPRRRTRPPPRPPPRRARPWAAAGRREPRLRMRPSRTALRLAAGAAALIVLWVIGAELPLLHWIALAAGRLQGAGLAGALLWGAGMYVATLLLVPIIPLILASGWLFGLWGIPVSLAAAVASAATSFGTARALGRGAFARWLLARPRARALAELTEDGGLATVALIRISPLLPFTPSNAVLGLTGLRARDLVLGTLFGMAPGIALYVWAGSLVPSAAALERHEVLGPLVWVLVGCSFAAAAVIGVAATRRLRPQRRA